MTVNENQSKEKWGRAHQTLSIALEKEITFMRDLLSTLHEEEMCLLKRDLKGWKKTMRDHSDLIVQLYKQRIRRMHATIDLTKLAVKLSKNSLLPPEEESSCEVLSKLDQLFALLDRTNLQNCRNDALFSQTKHEAPIPMQCPCPHPVYNARRKTTVATYNQSP